MARPRMWLVMHPFYDADAGGTTLRLYTARDKALRYVRRLARRDVAFDAAAMRGPKGVEYACALTGAVIHELEAE